MAVPTGATNGGYMVLVPPQSGATANVSALVNKDGSGNVAVPTEQYIQNASGLYVPVSSSDPLPTALTASSATIGNTGITSYGHLTGLLFNGGAIAAGATQYISGQNQEDIVAHIGLVFISAGATYGLKVGPTMIGNETAVAGIAMAVNNTYTTINDSGGASQNFATHPGEWADGYQIPADVFPSNILTYALTNTSTASAAYYVLEHLTQ